MININETSANSKIYIQRNITNDEPVINKYVTEDELQEQLKNINIPYLVIDHIKYDDGTWGYGIVSGDFNKVYDAIVNRKPQMMYVPDQQPKVFYIPTVFGYDTSTKKILAAVSHHNAVDLDFAYYIFEITENLVTQSYQSRNVQEKLVSGENIKTINGNDILGSGDIVIESGTDIPYLFIRNDGDIISGDFDAVYDAVKNDKPYLIYVYTFSNSGLIYSPAECVSLVNENDIRCTYDLTYVALNDETRLLYRVLTISKNGAAISMERERIIPTQFKTINGNEITGTGDIIIEGGTDIPYLLIKYEYPNNVIYGDFDGVVEAIVNNKPYLIYTPYLDYANTYIQPTTVTYNKNTNTITANSFIHSEVDRIQKLYYTITSNNVTSGNDILFVQPKLVSGENIKTINGNDILGEGDIIIEANVDLSDYYTKGETDNKYQPKGNYLTSIPEEYVTDSELTEK